jgi:hypothetical protein
MDAMRTLKLLGPSYMQLARRLRGEIPRQQPKDGRHIKHGGQIKDVGQWAGG